MENCFDDTTSGVVDRKIASLYWHDIPQCNFVDSIDSFDSSNRVFFDVPKSSVVDAKLHLISGTEFFLRNSCGRAQLNFVDSIDSFKVKWSTFLRFGKWIFLSEILLFV